MRIKEVTDTFNKANIVWWLDSGSLLGIIRSGSFLKQDHDIDIGILSGQKQFNDVLHHFLNSGFRAVLFMWGKTIYKCKLIPLKKTIFPYILDIQLYKKYGDDVVCPQMVFKTKLSLLNTAKKRIIRIKKSTNFDEKENVVKRIARRLLTRKTTKIQFKKNHSNLYSYYLWKIPNSYISTPFTESFGYQVFSNVKDYLAYRYGDWTIPKSDWDFTVDDKGLAKSSYGEISDLYR